MTNKQSRTYDRAQIIDERLGNVPALPPVFGPLLARLKRLIRAIGEGASTQGATTVIITGLANQVKYLRGVLRRKHMIPIARRGKIFFATEPSVLEALRVPHSTAHVDTLLAAAEKMVKVMVPYEAVLLEEGFTPGFLDRLTEAAAALKASAAQLEVARRKKITTTQELAGHFTELGGVTRGIDGHVVAEAYDNPGLGTLWDSVPAISKRLGRPTPRKLAARRKRESGASSAE
jgi:hypothetical protein